MLKIRNLALSNKRNNKKISKYALNIQIIKLAQIHVSQGVDKRYHPLSQTPKETTKKKKRDI